jgi:RNA polymerase sigma-70 factor (ECF subfamily)
VPLEEQSVEDWNGTMIFQAETLLLRASTLGAVGRFQLEAAVQSAHEVRRRTGRSDWAAIVRLYDTLAALTASPVVAINRAVALAETAGPAEGLASLDALADDPRLATYQPYWAARARLLARSGAVRDARAAYRQAIGLESDPAVRHFLQQQMTESDLIGSEAATATTACPSPPPSAPRPAAAPYGGLRRPPTH